MSKSKIKYIFINTILFTLVSILFVLIAEILFSLFHPASYVTTDILGRKIRTWERVKMVHFKYNEFETYDLEPNKKGQVKLAGSLNFEWRINTLSLRGPEIKKKKSDALRIFILGDSQTFGFVKEHNTYPSQLENILNDSLPIHVEVINGGVSGYGTFQCLWKLERLINKLKPDLVILTFFGSYSLKPCWGNDLYSNWSTINKHDISIMNSHEIIKKTSSNSSLKKLQQWIALHSHFYGLMSEIKRKILPANSVDSYNPDNDPNISEAWALTRDALLEAKNVSRVEANSDFFILYMPMISDLCSSDRRAADELKKMNLAFIDTFDGLKQIMNMKGDNLRSRLDAHYNGKALRKIADVTAISIIHWYHAKDK